MTDGKNTDRKETSDASHALRDEALPAQDPLPHQTEWALPGETHNASYEIPW